MGTLLRRLAVRLGLRRPSTVELFAQTRQALVRHRLRRAHRLAKRLVAQEPENVDAWFVYGVVLSQQGRFEDLINAIEPVANGSEAPEPGYAYLLGVAHFQIGMMAEARAWLKLAAASPEFQQEIANDPELANAMEGASREEASGRANGRRQS